MDENEVYCRVDDGKIVEYPVYAIHITNRAHPFSMYTKVVFSKKPELPDFSYYTQNIELLNGVPVVTYGVVYKSLQTVLNELHNRGSSPLPTLPGQEPTRVELEDVDQKTFERVLQLVKEMVQKRLDDWAKTREYDGIISVCTYANSTNATRAAEGMKAVANRDATWDSMYAYMDKISRKELPVPLTVFEINSNLPELTW